MKRRHTHINYLLTILWLLPLAINAQTPYDSFAPEATRPMICTPAERWMQKVLSDSVTYTIAIDTQNRTLYLINEQTDSLVAMIRVDQNNVMWLSVDPLADENISNSPYVYCSGNPIMLIDPKGMDDIFNEQGIYLRHVDNGTDYVMIENSDGVQTNIVDYSYAPNEFAHRNMLQNVMSYYARQVGIFTGVTLTDNPKNGQDAFMLTNTKTWLVQIVVNDGKIHPNATTASNILNTSEHEFIHFLDRKSGPYAELLAIAYQIQSASWDMTTETYKNGVVGYAIQNINKYLKMTNGNSGALPIPQVLLYPAFPIWMSEGSCSPLSCPEIQSNAIKKQ